MGEPVEAKAGLPLTHPQAVIMTPRYYHTPLKQVSTRPLCPVCNESVYSRAGIHPQCAVIQADPPKLRGKQKGAAAHVEQAMKTPDQIAVVVAPVPPIVGQTPPSDPPIRLELASITRISVKSKKTRIHSDRLRSVRLPS